jgi:hypothetical protein
MDGVSESDFVIKDPPPDVEEGKKVKARLANWKARP